MQYGILRPRSARLYRCAAGLLLAYALTASAANYTVDIWIHTPDTAGPTARGSALEIEYQNGGIWRGAGAGTWNAGGVYSLSRSFSGDYTTVLRVFDPWDGSRSAEQTFTLSGYQLVHFYALGASSAPPTWTLTGTYKNSSDYVRTLKIDYDGNGTIDETTTLQPGETWSPTWTLTSAPTQNGLITITGPGGVGLDGEPTPFFAFAQITPETWKKSDNTGGTGTHTATVTPGVTTTTDTGSKTTPSISYGESTGTASESTLKTGLAAVRSAVVEAGQNDAGLLSDIKALLKKLTTAADPNAVAGSVEGAKGAAQSAASSATSAVPGMQSTLANALATPAAPSGVSWSFTLPMLGTLSAAPWENASVAPLISFLYVLEQFLVMAACAWACIHMLTDAARHMTLAPQTPASAAGGALPLASSGVTLAISAIAVATIATGIAAAFAIFGSMFPGYSILSAGPWGGLTGAPALAVDALFHLVPVGTICVAAATTVIVYLSSNTIALSVAVVVRAISA
jgi:hypothetical protein